MFLGGDFLRYKICYDNKVRKKQIGIGCFSTKQIKYIIVGLMAAVTTIFILTGSTSCLREMFFRRNADTARRAINDMTSDLKNGESIVEVVQTFCREILDCADIRE